MIEADSVTTTEVASWLGTWEPVGAAIALAVTVLVPLWCMAWAWSAIRAAVR